MAAKDAKEAQTVQVEDDDEFEEFPKESLSHCAGNLLAVYSNDQIGARQRRIRP